MSCSKFHADFSKDFTLLKQTTTQLLSQNSLFQSALQELAKEIKLLKRENIQIRSKYDILQVRIKSIQGSTDHDTSPKHHSARKLGSPFKSDDGQFDFQFTSRLDNIVNQSTRNRLESLRKDLEGVLRGEEEKVEPTKEEKDAMTIMEEWSNPSELNISQTQSDRLTTVMLHAGDNTFGVAPSLMEQLDMLSVQQGSPKSPFEVESTADNSTFSRAVTFSFGGTKAIGGKAVENLSTLQTISDGNQHQQARQNHARGQVKNKSLESHHNNQAMSPVQTNQKLTVGGKVVPQLKLYGAGDQGKLTNSDAIPTFTGAETVTSLQKFSSEPSYLMDSRSEETAQNAQKQKNKQQVEAVPPVHFGTMDIKTKKELYLRGDNMLMGVLDRLEETVHKGGSPLFNTNGSSNQPETFRIQVNSGKSVEQNYYLKGGDHNNSEQDRIKRVHSSENAGNNNTINSGRGTTKKLRLGKLSMKGKDGLTSLHESLSSNPEI